MPRTIPTDPQWRQLETRALLAADELRRMLPTLARLVAVCRDAPSVPDGFPTGASGWAHDRSAATTYRETPTDDDAVALTSVEAAVDARGRHRDPLDAKVLAALAAVENAIDGVDGLARALLLIDRLRAAESPESDENGARCAVMARIGVTRPVHVRSTLGGLFGAEARPVCRWVYDFAGSTGRLPTEDEMRLYADGRRVMVRTGRVGVSS